MGSPAGIPPKADAFAVNSLPGATPIGPTADMFTTGQPFAPNNLTALNAGAAGLYQPAGDSFSKGEAGDGGPSGYYIQPPSASAGA